MDTEKNINFTLSEIENAVKNSIENLIKEKKDPSMMVNHIVNNLLNYTTIFLVNCTKTIKNKDEYIKGIENSLESFKQETLMALDKNIKGNIIERI